MENRVRVGSVIDLKSDKEGRALAEKIGTNEGIYVTSVSTGSNKVRVRNLLGQHEPIPGPSIARCDGQPFNGVV